MGKKILIITNVSGFLLKFERENVKILHQLGYIVHYAANMKEQHYFFKEEEMERMNVCVHHIEIERSPYMLRNNHRAFKQLLKIIRENDIEIIHCHTPVGGVLGRLAGRYMRGRNLTVIYTAHGFHFYRGAPLLNNTIYYMVERLLARYTDILITINKEDYQSAQKLHLKPGGKIYLVPGVGLDREYFSPLDAGIKEEFRRELGLEGKIFLVTAAELNENKNQYVVLKALAKMRNMGIDISGIIYGICGEGFFYDRMEKWIKDFDLEQNIRLYGYQTDVRHIVGCADAFVFPSKREGLGMAALEALSMGIPVIASDNRGTKEYMVEGVNGFLCRAENEDDFIKAIEKFMSMDKDTHKIFERKSRASIRKFDKKNTHRIMEEIYRGLANGGM